MLSARYGHAMLNLNDVVYVAGGKIGTTYSTYLSTVEVFENGSWRQIQSLPKAMSWHCMAKLDNNRIIVLGGTPSYSQSAVSK